MTISRAFLLSTIFAAVALGYSLIVSPSLPAIVPTHWDASGQVDGTGPKEIMLYLMPGIMILNALLMLVLPKLSPRKFEIDGFIGSYTAVWLVLEALFFCLHIIFIQATQHHSFDVTRWMMPILFLFFALMGNWMGKIRQNFYMGIRTPWTLSDSRVWDATHRAASKIWFFGGLAGGVVAMFGIPLWISWAAFILLALYPVYLSWAIYKRLTPEG